jgi:cellulose synthase (UDP-forming)
VQFAVLVACWIAASIVFWQWWFRPDRIIGMPQYVITTAAIMYDLIAMPLVFVFMLWKMKRPVPQPAPPGLRVAMVTAIVPSSESVEVLERTLAAMCAVRYPHDNWVLDEGGDERVRELCARYGAHYWSRKGIPEFNQPDWPHQAKTKSGNYNSWFVDVAYDGYDYLVQLDSDHAPVESYLDDVLGYFDDPEVAYIALPSVYWNLDDWPSRGSSEQSQIFQGPIQMGYYGWAQSPMIIGSHAAYRMTHLREIGGFAQSRAEDHLDTLRFTQHGYRGVFVPENLATGLGPHTLSDYIVQEHQWAFSVAQVLMLHARVRGLQTMRQRAVFLFSELWYSIFALTYLLLYALPLFALLTNEPLVSLVFTDFLKHALPATLIALLIVGWAFTKGWYRPGTHFLLSWQGILLTAARWPIVLIALVNAVISVVFRNGAFTYMVTPKGLRGLRGADSLRVALPFVVLAVTPIVIVVLYPFLIAGETSRAAGYILFAMMSAVLFTFLIIAGAADHINNNLKMRISLHRAVWGALPLLLIVALLIPGMVLGTTLNAASTRAALVYNPERAALVGDDGASQPPQDQPSSDPPAVGPDTNIPVVTDTPEPATVVPDAPTATSPSTPIPAEQPTATPEPLLIDSWVFDLAREGVTFGAFDPNDHLTSINSLQHLYAEWDRDVSGGIPIEEIDALYRSGVPVLLTYEPWPLDGHSRWRVLSDTSDGEYDDVIRAGARAIASLDQPMLIRFGHEMDINLLYPWSGRNPDRYVQAYQRVVTLFREEGATNVLWVWSPGGTLDAGRYYPGDAFVDYVGFTVLQYTVWELEAGHDEPRPIKDLLNEKYQLFLDFNKPMIVAEFGVNLTTDLENVALRDVIVSLPDFPHIRAVVYFNDRNPVNPVMNERPNWALTAGQRNLLAEALTESSWIEPPPGQR